MGRFVRMAAAITAQAGSAFSVSLHAFDWALRIAMCCHCYQRVSLAYTKAYQPEKSAGYKSPQLDWYAMGKTVEEAVRASNQQLSLVALLWGVTANCVFAL